MFFISMLTNLASALVTSSLLLLSYIVNTNGWLDVVPISNEVIEKLLLMNLIDGQNECKLSLAALLPPLSTRGTLPSNLAFNLPIRLNMRNKLKHELNSN